MAELKICGGGFVKCSCCKVIMTNYDNDKWNFCPNCGVKFEAVEAEKQEGTERAARDGT